MNWCAKWVFDKFPGKKKLSKKTIINKKLNAAICFAFMDIFLKEEAPSISLFINMPNFSRAAAAKIVKGGKAITKYLEKNPLATKIIASVGKTAQKTTPIPK